MVCHGHRVSGRAVVWGHESMIHYIKASDGTALLFITSFTHTNTRTFPSAWVLEQKLVFSLSIYIYIYIYGWSQTAQNMSEIKLLMF